MPIPVEALQKSKEQDSNQTRALAPIAHEQVAALRNALRLWSESTTGASVEQRTQALRYKRKTVDSFFAQVGMNPASVSAVDVERWRDDLRKQGLSPSTVYARVSFLSSFYSWAMRDPALGEAIRSNPARLALPKAPKAYQTESVKALTDKELYALVNSVRKRAATGDTIGKRDYALLLFYITTGMRRQEIISLRGRQIEFTDDTITLSGKVKGGDYVGREVADPLVRRALLDYLAACGRTDVLGTDAPIWTRHDRAGRPGAQLSSHAFVKNLKLYARDAGLAHVHLHQTRHTYARIVAEETGSIIEVQDALGHADAATTRVYVQRIAVKRDRHSSRITNRLTEPAG